MSFDLVLNLVKDGVLTDNLVNAGAGRVLALSGGSGKKHAVDSLLDILSPYPVLTDGVPKLPAGREEEEFAARFMEENGLAGAYVAAFHPGSGSAGKNWSADKFVETAKELSHEFGFKILMVSGEADDGPCARFASAFGQDEIVAARSLKAKLLGALLGKCRVYAGNDSGVSHLAAAAGAASVCVFGPTDPDVWAPRGKTVIVRSGAGCSPCTREKMSACADRVCLTGIEPGTVLHAARGLLSHDFKRV